MLSAHAIGKCYRQMLSTNAIGTCYRHRLSENGRPVGGSCREGERWPVAWRTARRSTRSASGSSGPAWASTRCVSAAPSGMRQGTMPRKITPGVDAWRGASRREIPYAPQQERETVGVGRIWPPTPYVRTGARARPAVAPAGAVASAAGSRCTRYSATRGLRWRQVGAAMAWGGTRLLPRGYRYHHERCAAWPVLVVGDCRRAHQSASSAASAIAHGSCPAQPRPRSAEQGSDALASWEHKEQGSDALASALPWAKPWQCTAQAAFTQRRRLRQLARAAPPGRARGRGSAASCPSGRSRRPARPPPPAAAPPAAPRRYFRRRTRWALRRRTARARAH
jgi:hypothetical protein